MKTSQEEIEYSSDLVDKYLDGDHIKMRWIDLNYEILYAKAIYYKLVSYGFKPMIDEEYDLMEQEYKEISEELGYKPEACELVGWIDNPILEALAMKVYDEKLYEQLKNSLFEFKP
jgi:hypothetical protein